MAGATMIVGIDIGGTFTDLVCRENGSIRTVKVSSTPADFSQGFSEALDQVSQGTQPATEIVHATTVATNALIQRKGARVGLITTRGFRDVLSMRRRDRRSPYGAQTAFVPLVPRELRREVNERSSSDAVIVAVDPDEVIRVAESLWDDGAEALLVAFLHSATCPENESIAKDALDRRWPDRPIFASHALSDVTTEFERFSTGAASAYVAPLVQSYLGGIEERLERPEVLRVVVSDGGLVPRSEASANPVRTALSGPAAGVWGARAVCESIGKPAFIACDMGGTSFDACLVSDGSPALTRNRTLSFGIPLAVEMLDIATIGAGGGSIVTVSPVGTVQVGPEGVGADPGPACYGRQVHRATVTDADLVLGRIPTELRLPSGTRVLDLDAARKTINERVAQPIGVSVEEAASLVVSTVEEKMSDQIRQMALKSRVDLSGHVLFAYGGAGPLHAAGIADPLGIDEIVVPPNAGLFSAWGGLLTQPRGSVSSVGEFALSDDGNGRLGEILGEHRKRLSEYDSDIAHVIDARHVGTTRTFELNLAEDDSCETISDRLTDTFGLPGPWVADRVSSTAACQIFRDLTDLLPEKRGSKGDSDVTTRNIRFGDSDAIECMVYDRETLEYGQTGEGPCVIEEPGATTVVPPAFDWMVGELGMLHLVRQTP